MEAARRTRRRPAKLHWSASEGTFSYQNQNRTKVIYNPKTNDVGEVNISLSVKQDFSHSNSFQFDLTDTVEISEIIGEENVLLGSREIYRVEPVQLLNIEISAANGCN